jgi:hypothetical protein
LRESQRAVDLLPLEKDACSGMERVKHLSVTVTWTDDRDLACRQLCARNKPPLGIKLRPAKATTVLAHASRRPVLRSLAASLAPQDRPRQ